ncbi:SRPBCC domain-containing protein [Streptomyces sp. NPDC003781]|uniref:SRPBCC family protein n=1 Tax=Streptomyces sp. NPDC003781 TaxID=3364686 RepID=UPI00368358BF
MVASERIGRRRINTLGPAALRELAAELSRIAETAEQAGAPSAIHQHYGAALRTERHAATEAGWADGRSFRFRRHVADRPEPVWRHLTEPALPARWWSPDDLHVCELVFEARPGGRIVQTYRDAEDTDGRDVIVGRAEGTVDEVHPHERLAHRISPPASRRHPGLHRTRRPHLPAQRDRHRPGRPLADNRELALVHDRIR